MIDKNLLRLLGDNKKYIFYTVGLMVLGLFANVGITASICWAINLPFTTMSIAAMQPYFCGPPYVQLSVSSCAIPHPDL